MEQQQQNTKSEMYSPAANYHQFYDSDESFDHSNYSKRLTVRHTYIHPCITIGLMLENRGRRR